MSRWTRASVLLAALAVVAPRLAWSEDAAEVTCKDGTKSHAGKGACSGHGGVDKSAGAVVPATSAAAPAAPSAPAAAPAPPKAAAAPSEGKGPPTAKCKDGTLSYSQHHTGTCSNHGGVAEWLDGTQAH